mmetsp:Transcript_49272/g.115243  ORF Transcript_49272/g.115243 Transcript_49272/m.115243 type:complete len:216 (+) Transcript_49272:93-740(+)
MPSAVQAHCPFATSPASYYFRVKVMLKFRSACTISAILDFSKLSCLCSSVQDGSSLSFTALKYDKWYNFATSRIATISAQESPTAIRLAMIFEFSLMLQNASTFHATGSLGILDSKVSLALTTSMRLRIFATDGRCSRAVCCTHSSFAFVTSIVRPCRMQNSSRSLALASNVAKSLSAMGFSTRSCEVGSKVSSQSKKNTVHLCPVSSWTASRGA